MTTRKEKHVCYLHRLMHWLTEFKSAEGLRRASDSKQGRGNFIPGNLVHVLSVLMIMLILSMWWAT